MPRSRLVSNIYDATRTWKYSLSEIGQKLASEIGFNPRLDGIYDNTLRRKVHKELKCQSQYYFEEMWYKSISSQSSVFHSKKYGNKLRTYCKFKRTLSLETYLLLKIDLNSRKSLTNLRISSHKLRVETGRYEKPCLPVNQRTCEKCNISEIEDEKHFVIRCKLYDKERKHLFNKLNLNNLDEDIIFYKLMQCQDFSTAINFSKFIQLAFDKRQKH